MTSKMYGKLRLTALSTPVRLPSLPCGGRDAEFSPPSAGASSDSDQYLHANALAAYSDPRAGSPPARPDLAGLRQLLRDIILIPILRVPNRGKSGAARRVDGRLEVGREPGRENKSGDLRLRQAQRLSENPQPFHLGACRPGLPPGNGGVAVPMGIALVHRPIRLRKSLNKLLDCPRPRLN